MFIDRIPVRFRISLGHALCMSLIYICLGCGLYKILEVNLADSVDTALISSARAIKDTRELNSLRDAVLEQLLPNSLQLEPLLDAGFIKPYAQIINMSGKVRSKTNNIVVALPISPQAINRAEAGKFTFETFKLEDGSRFRQVTMPVTLAGKFTGEIIQVAASLSQTTGTLKGTAFLLWLLLPSTLLISIFVAYIFTARALKPVKQISGAATKMGIDDLSIRLPISEADDELRALSQAFNSMLDRLEDAVKRLRRFTGDVSHELRTPLAVLRGEAELALRRPRDGDYYSNSLEKIRKESLGMSEIVEDLLLLAKAESKAVAMNLQELSVKQLMEEVCAQVKPIFDERQVSLKRACSDASVISCSRTYLSLALKNILLNASKHSSAGQVVYFTVYETEQDMVFTIEDEGEGIPEASLPNIFDPFYRADTARNRDSGGAGIGLSLTMALVKLHGGTIKVSSQVGKGTCFKALIPHKKKEAEANKRNHSLG